MKNIKLNEKEMTCIYGGKLVQTESAIEPDGLCTPASNCVCHESQPYYKVQYGENMSKKDANWGN